MNGRTGEQPEVRDRCGMAGADAPAGFQAVEAVSFRWRTKSRGKGSSIQIHHAKRAYALTLIKKTFADFEPALAAEMLQNTTASKYRARRCASGWLKMGFGCPAKNVASSANHLCAESVTAS